jgi:hypothetical protein
MSKLQTGYSKITGKELTKAFNKIYQGLIDMNYNHTTAHGITKKIEKDYKKIR